MMMTVMKEGRYGVKMKEKSECKIHARKFVVDPKKAIKLSRI